MSSAKPPRLLATTASDLTLIVSGARGPLHSSRSVRRLATNLDRSAAAKALGTPLSLAKPIHHPKAVQMPVQHGGRRSANKRPTDGHQRSDASTRYPREGTQPPMTPGANLQPTFADLGVDPRLVSVLEADGILAPFAIQIESIPESLAGRDVLGKARTGSGKTLAFSLPIVSRLAEGSPETRARHPQALVLAPTRELASQVTDVVSPLADTIGFRTISIYGGTNMKRDHQRLAEPVDILVATPGRLIDLIEQDEVSLESLRFVAIDEADRMCDLGFFPQVDWLLRQVGADAQIMLFSATLDGSVGQLVERHLNNPTLVEVQSDDGETVPDMEHRFLEVHHMDKAKVIAALIEASGRAIVFCRTKRNCDRLSRDLGELGVKAPAIHSDLRQKMRERTLSRFANHEVPALIATDVAARGIHVDDVTLVIHADPAENAKDYLHRSGRTARAGASGLVVTLIEWDQKALMRVVLRELSMQDSPIVRMFSNDPRLADLTTADLSQDDA